MPAACAFCRFAGAALLCSACTSELYCDATCQRAHWRAHKPYCVAARAAPPRPVDEATACAGCRCRFADAERKCYACNSVAYRTFACEEAHKVLHKRECTTAARMMFTHTLELAGKGDVAAMSRTAENLLDGKGCAIDKVESLTWFERNMAAGGRDGLHGLGMWHARFNAERAVATRFFLRSAEAGHAPSFLTIAYRLEDDHPAEAIRWFLRANEEEAGSISAHRIGRMYWRVGNAGEAEKWLSRALNDGEDSAEETRAALHASLLTEAEEMD